MKARRELAKMLDPIKRRVRAMVSRAVLDSISDGGGLQILRVHGFAGEVLDSVERFQPYGLTSVPLAGAEAIVAAIAGSRAHVVALVVDDRRERPTGLSSGETMLYDHAGNRIHLKADGTISIDAVSEVSVTAPTVNVTADDATVTADAITLDSLVVTIAGRDFLTHTHSDVEPGGGDTGGVN